ncbi:alpha/beta hydrolase-fold protein [Methyloligella sp. 2.7D]|uniref:alpha/beta hydrolase n=1 Tax=unclassified Methyloligella TaxID=2625955 RepID=UPI00157DEB92|nr:alpha/beta hydrolase-fold protein [Methyloligella sp. GL2]QKP78144.1 alpha/beta hydrolase [Methyloligella sp. GL2]
MRAIFAAILLLASGLGAFGVSTPGAAQDAAPAQSAYPPLTLKDTEVRDMTASGSGRPYRIFIRKPATPPPPEGFPVIYAVGANANFLTFVEAMRNGSENPIRTGIAPAIVVGIGFPIEGSFDIKRWVLDYTLPAERYDLPQRPNKKPWPPMGGADETLDFIENDLKPAIARDFTIAPAKETLMGHSFGGLFALHTLFTRPGLFDTYLAASPSIWFNDRQVLTEMDSFLADLPADLDEKQLYIGVGGLEEAPAPDDKTVDDPKLHAKWKDHNRMIGNASELVGALKEKAPALSAELHVFPGENHGTILPVFITHTLPIAAPAVPAPAGDRPVRD